MITGTNGNDSLLGTDGDDLFDGGLGIDTLVGGLGQDTYVIRNISTVIREDDTEDEEDTVELALTAAGTYQLAANVEHVTVTAANTVAVNVVGNALNNILIGNGAANTLTGGAGHDTLDGGAGADRLVGGAGDDRYYVDNVGDVVVEAANDGYEIVYTTLSSYTLGANIESVVYEEGQSFTGVGNALGNMISGGGAGNVIDGGAGNDFLEGGDGNDSMQGGIGDDIIIGIGRGRDTVDGGAGNDLVEVAGALEDYQIVRTGGNEGTLTDADGNVTILRNVERVITKGDVWLEIDEVWAASNTATAYNDRLQGTDGDDTLDGLGGVDTLAGGAGDDTYLIRNVGSVVVENADEGTDLVQVALAAAGTYALAANVENATVTAAKTVAVNLTGGIGDDDYYVDHTGDVVTELAGEGHDNVFTTLASYTLGANLEQLYYQGAAVFTGTGNALDNRIQGGDAGNRIDGGAGNDVLGGGAGNDSMQGGTGDDTIVGIGSGRDTVDGGVGLDVLQVTGAIGDYTVTRPSVTDTVLTDADGNVITLRNIESIVFTDGTRTLAQLQDNIASVGNDVLRGTADNDVLNGLGGIDTLSGGDGDDTYIIANAASVIVENADEGHDLVQVALTAAATYTLAANVEDATVTAAASVAVNLTGNALDNTLTGNAAANTLIGGAGNDVLDGGAGSDRLQGGLGDDIYVVDAAGDVVSELADQGVDAVRTALASYTLSANVENLIYTGSGNLNGSGNALDNVILGGSGNDSLQGGAGYDSLYAATGKDTIDGGADIDLVTLSGNFDSYTITRPNANDTVFTDAAGNVTTVRNVETFHFADGDKTLAQVQFNIASAGNDSLTGTSGADLLNGGAGVDTLVGGDGDDVYVISNVNSVVVELADGGEDEVQVALTSAGTYVLPDNVEKVIATGTAAINLTGNAQDNWLVGNAAANVLIGGAGNDVLQGGAGNDTMRGGVDNDVYYVDQAGDVVIELADEGTDSVVTTLSSYTMAANIEMLGYTGSTGFTGIGNALDNYIMPADGYTGNVKLDGGAGNDSLIGGAGNDSLLGGLGDDVFNSIYGKDTIDGGLGDDRVLRGEQPWQRRD